ncbi:4'-phosphopantetheinyl transferase superfamily protein [Jatrophihabitans telluris]|uniref:4'-phosphopantetheinyl transferase superfamily protein n=1 Tax=Jatrophihabitans telluris TaxID=2038343 RepID=A0ABY4QWV3_9ACTN|nr:4'-phosphopantetheinyl transferase superfamily protein [Jatrophihabitans telluris]UQX87737.1 4'-phosphopantetheinyl transferase superfamily protein [Jatrophihabitans telluris]
MSILWAPLVAAQDVWLLLSPDERRRHERYLRPHDQDRFASGRALARLALAALTGQHPAAVQLLAECRRCGGAHGQLRVAGKPSTRISLSRAGERVLFGYADTISIGVDVELVSGTGFDGFDGVVLAPVEHAEDAAQRAVIWTRKEAVLKASGWGLTIPPDQLQVSAPTAPAALHGWLAHEPSPGPVQLIDLAAPPGYRAALAALTDRQPRLRVLDGEQLFRTWAGSAGPDRTARR